jgi:hypothetical protein
MSTNTEREDGIDLGMPGTGATGFSVTSPAEPVLSGSRIAEVLDGVFRLHDHWTERSPGFHTLGLSLYKDGQAAEGERLDVRESNARLEEVFGPALADLRTAVSREVGAEVEWAEGLPLPGFHVLERDALQPGQPAGNSHFDIQYIWGGFEERVLDVLSVTVPVKVPAAGTSLEYWEIDFAGYERLFEDGEVEDLADVERRLPMREVRYEPGRACVMRGLPLHRIGTSPAVQPSDYRITLQGHAVRLGERWVAYW